MVLGQALHVAVLEPELFKQDYLLLPEVKDRRASAYKEAVKTHDADLTLIGHEANYIAGMQESMSNNQTVSARLKAAGRSEVSVITTDPETGVAVRCRFDRLSDLNEATDLKKTQDARAPAFSRSVANYTYHVQQAFYSDVWEWETGEKLKDFLFCAVEEKLPHAAMLYQLDDEAVEYGRKLYREALNYYAECLNKDIWPAYSEEVEMLSLPTWAAPDVEDNFTFDEDQ